MSNMVVRTNVFALNAHRNLKNVGVDQSRASSRLSSGYRINSAADDAAGLAISESMRAQIRGLDQASRNAQDGQALITTAEGGMQEIQNMLQRIRELTVQAANDTNTEDNRSEHIALEIRNLLLEIDDMANRVEYNGMTLLNGDFANTVPLDDAEISALQGALTTFESGVGVVLDGLERRTEVVPAGYADRLAASADARARLAGLEIVAGENLGTITYDGVAIESSGPVLSQAHFVAIVNFLLPQESPHTAWGPAFSALQASAAFPTITTPGNDDHAEPLWASDPAAVQTGNNTGARVVLAALKAAADTQATRMQNAIDNPPAPTNLGQVYGRAPGTAVLSEANVIAVANFMFGAGAGEDAITEIGAARTALYEGISGVTDGALGNLLATASEGVVTTDMAAAIAALEAIQAAAAAHAIAVETAVETGVADGHFGQGGLRFQVGANENQLMWTSIRDMRVLHEDFGTRGSAATNGTAGEGRPNPNANAVNHANVGSLGNAMQVFVNNWYQAFNVEQGETIDLTQWHGWDGEDLQNFTADTNFDPEVATGAQALSAIIESIEAGIQFTSLARAELGAVSNRLEFTARSLDISSENLSDAESRVRNADMAREMMAFTMANVLQQASVSMLAQANQLPNNLLQLLR